jgi:ketosteroid isomerase-like protein
MRRKLICLAFIFLFAFIAPAQQLSANTEERLIALEKMWDQAQLLRDAGALNHLISPNFINTEWDGTVSGRQKFLADIRDPLYKPITMSIQNVFVQLYGSTAIVTGTYHSKGSYKDRSYDHVGRFTDTWIFENGRWICIASQASLISKK